MPSVKKSMLNKFISRKPKNFTCISRKYLIKSRKYLIKVRNGQAGVINSVFGLTARCFNDFGKVRVDWVF